MHFRLSDEQARLLGSVLDTIVPRSRDGTMPSALELGIAAQIEQACGEEETLREAVVAGLEALASDAAGADFGALPFARRCERLQALAASQPSFLPNLIFRTYVAYYADGRVLEALGLEPRPPHPKGHELEPGDFTLLDAVRRRGPIHRPC